MSEQWNDELRKSETEQLPPEEVETPRSAGRWIAGGLLLVAAAIAAYIGFGRGALTSGPDVTQTPVVSTPSAAPEPLGGAADAVALPPLDESDPIVRKLAAGLSSHPHVAAWLATDGLVRNFTAVVVNIADGNAPSSQVRVLRPSSAFVVRAAGEDLEIDPRSYTRYNGLADAVASVDAAGASQLYSILKPRLEEAHRELGLPDASFDRPLERALVLLLRTPVVDGQVQVAPKGIGYRFLDPALENLTAAQKQLLRMGPRNVRLIQGKLREIALALGIPESRLPQRR